ncbi:MAG: hypothetical protein HOV79_01100 [Hamadaea sp.]|nr:hypothetical protein [Hamadaea sp.]
MRGAVLLGTGAALGGVELMTAGAALAVTAPTIASCATWGARSASSTLTQISTNPNKIIIHHTATPNSTDYSLSHAYALARSIQNYHMDSNGWSDTGQHFTVSRGGHAVEGRHYSLSHLTSGSGMVVGAHCPGQNDKAIGIENEGTYTSTTPTTALYDKLVQLCAYICEKYGIASSQIYGHRDFISTACPGDAFYAMLPGLRADVAEVLSGGTAWSTIVDNTSSGFRASANWGTSTYSTQRYGADYRYANPVAASDAAYYSATLPSSGNYKIETWYAANSGYNATTPYVVFSSAGNQSVTVNQQINGGKWNTVGTFAFASGARDVVAVSRWTNGTGYVIADAIRITKV